ncbi:TonB-dependent receptor plug domain-containing protein [Pseudemcibacter aquimaris]|uniref:TonB-dependent receptor plug domain-containing protein n=1 Tax=Pseudemcibacter aquimaris TaxID=2857064 RepID=UPI0020129C3D|nr:TonB-dependent receptor plug domain-containing protein [Pseudemcibacter aquimaris]MCC3859816.1 outer membrane beta-barrel protein [Pseudemcibacter aquimaris]WDU60210.1 outer membrane beta-barrel protein [Pseudemcibacter aquimaris]
MYNKNSKLKHLSYVLMTTAISASVATAQEASNTDDAAIVTYGSDFFVEYAPVTLLDMLQRVPGVQEILNRNRQQRGGRGGGAQNRGERGFGSGGDQILIDGKRLAGKSNNIDDTLGRISAEQVERVELIRGAASGLDVQSQGLVVNIVLKSGASNSSTFWNFKSETKEGNKPGFEALISHSGTKGALNYTLSAARTSNNGFFTRYENFYDDMDVHTDNRLIDNENRERGYRFNANIDYNFEEGAVLRLNGQYEGENQVRDEARIRTGDSPQSIRWLNDDEEENWEVGGDFSTKVGIFGDFKALFVINRRAEDENAERYADTDTTAYIYTDEDEYTVRKEKIFRGSFTNPLGSKMTLEVGGEAAINTFDKSFESYTRDEAVDPFELAAEDRVEIKENRYEIFANHTFNATSKLVIQSSLITEFSNIVAENLFPDGSLLDRRDTSFTYFKPRVNVRYDVTGSDQIRLTAEKKVSQLEFDNFVTRYDQRIEQYQYGNTKIRPEQLWEFLVAYEHRFPNDGGSFEVEGFYRDFTDKITRVDFTQYYDFGFNPIDDVDAFFALNPNDVLREFVDDNGEGFVSKSGNVDSANTYGANVKASVRLGFLGVPDAVISANYTYEKSDIVDQFTTLSRRFDRQSIHRGSVNFRHDMTDIGLSYGGRLSFTADAATQDINYYWPYSPQMNVSVFAEYNIMPRVRLRIDAKQLTTRRGFSTQTIYSDHRRFNDVSTTIDRKTYVPRELEISLSGTF